MYTSIQPERLYERIVAQIQQRIVSGKLKEGDQLPPERELAEQFGVSRIAVREAVKALREKGLVQIRPGKGTFVADRTLRSVHHSLDLMMKIGATDRSDHLVEVREILEPEIAALAALRTQDEQIEKMQQAIAKMETCLHNADGFIQADLDFHLALAEGTQNPLIAALMNSIIGPLREHRKRIFNTTGAPARGQSYHKRILDAVRKHDPVIAHKAMRAHLSQVRKDSQPKSRRV